MGLRPFDHLKFTLSDIKTDGYWAYLCCNLEVTSGANRFFLQFF
jgi:hypothetical protein